MACGNSIFRTPKGESRLKKCALCVLADPATYPHIARHVAALRGDYDEIWVYCTFKNSLTLPALDGVVWRRLAPEMPQGVRDFAVIAGVLWSLLQKDQPDAVEAIDPPTLLAAGPWCRKWKKPLLYFSMELWSELPSLQNRPFKKWLWAALEKWALPRRGVRLATVSAGVAHLLGQQLSRSVDVIRSIPPKPSKNRLSKDLRKALKLEQHDKILVYQGLLEEGRGLAEICQAVMELDQWHFVIIGSGPIEADLRQSFDAHNRIYFTGRMPYGDSLEWIAGADAGVVYIRDLGLSFRHCLPGKVFEYLHCGLPLLISPLPDLQGFLAEHPLGVCAQDWSQQALVAALGEISIGLQEKRWQQKLSVVVDELNWESEGRKLLELMAGARGELEFGEGRTV